jgi:hypothetical protein
MITSRKTAANIKLSETNQRGNVVISLALVAITTVCHGCVGPPGRPNFAPEPQSPDFSKTRLLGAPAALKAALELQDKKVGLDRSKFRIDMRRIYGGWWVSFITVPESPDQWFDIRVYDDGRIEQLR